MNLGIDQSFTSTGIVLVDNGAVVHKELIMTEKGEDPLQIFHRTITIKNRILEVCKGFSVSSVVIEGLGFSARGDATRNLAGLQFVVISSLIEELNLNPHVLPPTSLKKLATGKGTASKEEMVEAVKETDESFHKYLLTVGKTKGRFDLADAFWLAHYHNLKER